MKRDPKALDERVESLQRRCREAGLLVTPQRIAIYRALLEAEDHPSPEALFDRVRPSMPSLSLATVYKTLDTLRALGAARRVPVCGEGQRHDANLDHHHHLVCTRCGGVSDLYNRALDRIAPPRKLAGFLPEAVSVQITGICPRCARGAARAKPRVSQPQE